MTFLDSLLDAIIRLEGDALVMHVGERPYVVTTSSRLNPLRGPLAWGQVELSSRPLTTEAVLAMLGQILPADVRRTLDDLGAIEHQIEGPGGQDFIVIAARGGEDIWVEVRRAVEEEPAAAAPEVVSQPEAPQAEAAGLHTDAHSDHTLAAVTELEVVDVPGVYGEDNPLAGDVQDEDWQSVSFGEPADASATPHVQLAGTHDAAAPSTPVSLEPPSAAADAAAGEGERLLSARLEALEAEADAALAAREAELVAATERTLAERAEALAAESAAALARREAVLVAATERTLAERAEALAAESASALARREAELVAATDRTLAQRAEALAAESASALVRREAELVAATERTLAERAEALAAESAAALAAREAELVAATERTLAERAEALAAESASALARREAELVAATERTLAERADALAAESAAALARREAELVASTERALSERVAAMAAEYAAASAQREADLIAASERQLADRAQALSVREGELVSAAERALAEKAAALAAESATALAVRETEILAAAERSVVEQVDALRREIEAAAAARETEWRALADRHLAERETELRAASERAFAERAAALAMEAEAALAAKEAAWAVEAEARLAAREAALFGSAEQSLAERTAALNAAIEAALAEREAQAERVLAERMAAVAAEAEAALASREAAWAAEAQARLAEREAELAAATEAALAERAAALVAEAAAAQAEREAAAAALLAAAHAEAAAALSVKEAEAAAALAAREAEVSAALAAREAELSAALAVKQAEAAAAIAAKESDLAAAEAKLAEREAALAAAEEAAARRSESPAAVAEHARYAGVAPDRSFAPAAEHGPAEAAAGAVVLPLSRPTLKLQLPLPDMPVSASTEASLVELLRTAAAYRASTVYALVDARPMMRVDGQTTLLASEPHVAAGDVERFIFQFAPHDQVADAAPEWTCTVPEVGRVRCVTFRDQSGAGLIFHLPSPGLSTAEEIGLSRPVQALCDEADGLVVVAGPRSSGKSTLLNAFVDLINRTRYDHVITIESRIRVLHEKRLSFVSQREVRGDGEAIAAAARAALREGPDVLVIEDLRAPEALVAALDAARAGRLVFGSISAPTAPIAIERLTDAFPADRRPQIRASLAGVLRAVVAQVLVRKASGGRVPAREVLLSSPTVKKLVLDGVTAQLPIAIESGRGLGMVTMVDALGRLVRDGIVDIGEACRAATDRTALLAALERDGVDVSGVERRA